MVLLRTFQINIFALILMCSVASYTAPNLLAQSQDTNEHNNLFNLSIEELMDIEVTSISKKEEKIIDTPAAVDVITKEDIRCSGATCIPEALQMVPGIEVAKVDNNKRAISSRGFNRLMADKLLVLIDGRSVYTPLFAGIYSFIQIQTHLTSSSTNTVRESMSEDSLPHSTFHVISYFDLPSDFEFDTALYYVDNVPFRDIPHYIRLDARLGWHIQENMELSIVGQNLLDPHYPEFDDDSVINTEVQRSFLVESTYRF